MLTVSAPLVPCKALIKSPVANTPLKSIETVSFALIFKVDIILFVTPADPPLGTSETVKVAAVEVVLQITMFLIIVFVLAGAV